LALVAAFAALVNDNLISDTASVATGFPTFIGDDFPLVRGDSILRFFFAQSGQMVRLEIASELSRGAILDISTALSNEYRSASTRRLVIRDGWLRPPAATLPLIQL
jgi:hypothetical protein